MNLLIWQRRGPTGCRRGTRGPGGAPPPRGPPRPERLRPISISAAPQPVSVPFLGAGGLPTLGRLGETLPTIEQILRPTGVWQKGISEIRPWQQGDNNSLVSHVGVQHMQTVYHDVGSFIDEKTLDISNFYWFVHLQKPDVVCFKIETSTSDSPRKPRSAHGQSTNKC